MKKREAQRNRTRAKIPESARFRERTKDVMNSGSLWLPGVRTQRCINSKCHEDGTR